MQVSGRSVTTVNHYYGEELRLQLTGGVLAVLRGVAAADPAEPTCSNSHHITCTATEGYTLHNHVHNSHAGIDIVFPRTRALVDPHGLYESEGLYGRICPQSLRSWSGRLRPCPAGATVLRGKVKPKRKSCNWLARKRPRIIRFTLFSAPDPV